MRIRFEFEFFFSFHFISLCSFNAATHFRKEKRKKMVNRTNIRFSTNLQQHFAEWKMQVKLQNKSNWLAFVYFVVLFSPSLWSLNEGALQQ